MSAVARWLSWVRPPPRHPDPGIRLLLRGFWFFKVMLSAVAAALVIFEVSMFIEVLVRSFVILTH